MPFIKVTSALTFSMVVGKVGGHLGASGSFTKQCVISEQAPLMHKTQATHTIA